MAACRKGGEGGGAEEAALLLVQFDEAGTAASAAVAFELQTKAEERGDQSMHFMEAS